MLKDQCQGVLMEGSSYYIVHESAMPPVLKKVAEANRLLSSGKARTVNEAAEMGAAPTISLRMQSMNFTTISPVPC